MSGFLAIPTMEDIRRLEQRIAALENSRTNAGATSNSAVEEAPEGARPPAAPSGALTSVLKVLADHKPFEYAGINTGYFWCLNSRGHNHATHGDWRWQDWCEHVSPLIAVCVEKVTLALPEM